MKSHRSHRAARLSRGLLLAALALIPWLGACSERPAEEVRDPAVDTDTAPAEDPYSQLVASFDSSGSAGAEAAWNADRATLLLFSASW